MKKTKPASVLILTIITLGVYGLFIQGKARQELNKRTKIHIPSVLWLIVSLILVIISIFYYFIENFYNRVLVTAIHNGSSTVLTSNASGIRTASFMLGASFFLFLGIDIFWQTKFALAVNKVTQRRVKTGLTAFLLVFAPYIGLAYIQSVLNGGKSSEYFEEPATTQEQHVVEAESRVQVSPLEKAVARLAILASRRAQAQAATTSPRAQETGQDLRDRFRNHSENTSSMSNAQRQLRSPIVIGL